MFFFLGCHRQEKFTVAVIAGKGLNLVFVVVVFGKSQNHVFGNQSYYITFKSANMVALLWQNKHPPLSKAKTI